MKTKLGIHLPIMINDNIVINHTSNICVTAFTCFFLNHLAISYFFNNKNQFDIIVEKLQFVWI